MLTLLRRHRGAWMLILSALTFLPLLGRRDIVTSHEARVGLVARQMAASGWPWSAAGVDVPQVRLAHTPQGERLLADPQQAPLRVNPWLVPVMTGQIRMQKPPLPYWCGAVCDRLLGDRESSLRLVPALLGVLAAWLVWDWVRMISGPVGAWYAGLVWISSYFIVDEYRKAMADPYLAFFTLMALWAWTRAGAKPPRASLLLFYLALALGALAKGPVIFLYVPLLLGTYHVCYRRRLPGRASDHALGVLLFLALALPWPVTIYCRVPHALEFWRYESVGTFSDNVEKARGWAYYLPNLLQIALPWTPLWMLGLAAPLIRPTDRRRWFAVAATTLIVFVFSLSFVKKNAYLLPLMPVQTLLIADALVWLTVWARMRQVNRPTARPMLQFAGLAIGLAVAVQVFLSGWVAPRANRNSARLIAQQVTSMLSGSASTALLTRGIPEDAAYYLLFDLLQRPATRDCLVIVDDRTGDPMKNLADQLGGLSVARTESIPLAVTTRNRWHAYRVTLNEPSQATTAPATGQD